MTTRTLRVEKHVLEPKLRVAIDNGLGTKAFYDLEEKECVLFIQHLLDGLSQIRDMKTEKEDGASGRSG